MASFAQFIIQVKEFKPCIQTDARQPFWVGPVECLYQIAPVNFKAPTTHTSAHNHHYPTHTNGEVSLHVGHFQKPHTLTPNPRIPTTIRLESHAPQAVLRIDIKDANGHSGVYLPIGVGFWRADGTLDIDAPFTTGPKGVPIEVNGKTETSPFSNVKLNETPGTLEVEVRAISHLHSKAVDEIHKQFAKDKNNKQEGSHRTYRFIIFIQERRSGNIGVIDPEIEPPV
jgi:hypothetical protein